MYELLRLTEHDYVIDCPTKIGVVLTGEKDAVLIDSGSDKDAGKRILRVIGEQGWELKTVLITHSHADHIGGCRFLQDKTGCGIYAAEMEWACASYPLLEPTVLYGGLPFADLRHKFMLAQQARISPLSEAPLPEGMQVLSLPGHSGDMTGFLTAEGTAFLGDCVFSEETAEKYGIPYLWDPAASIATLDKLSSIPAQRFVPAHAPILTEIGPLAEVNRRAIHAVEDRILSILTRPMSFETILKAVFEAYGLRMNAQQYVLVGSTVRSYLSSLSMQGRIGYEFTDNEML